MAQRNKIVQWLVNMPASHLATILTVTALILVIFPQAFPIKIDPNAQAYFNFIEAMKPGDVFIYDVSTNIQSRAVCQANDMYILVHLFAKPGIKFIGVSFAAPGPVNWETDLTLVPANFLAMKKYCTDYVYLGYIPGDQSGIAAFCSNIRSIKTTDYYGTPIDNLPLMKSGNPKTGGVINDASCFYGTLFTYWNAAMIQAYAQVFGDTWHVPIVRVSSSWVTDSPYYPKYLVAYLFSAQYVQYEFLVFTKYGYAGVNQVYYTIQAVACAMFVGLIAVANIAYWGDRYVSSRRKEAVVK